MKIIFTFILIGSSLVSGPLFAETNCIPSIREQLENLNKCWMTQNYKDQILISRGSKLDEVSLIKLHLSLVEQKLRVKPIDHLTAEQRNNRKVCLDILHEYWVRGIFPENLYHKKRTPYFIDHRRTACAVGQLIISTGFEDFALKISRENNYAYISDLNEKYPQVKKWADEFGFTIDELAWIQPGYVICDTTCNQQASIMATGGNPPYSFLWSNGQATSNVNSLCPGAFYSCLVRDSQGDTIPGSSCTITFQAVLYLGTNSFYVPSAQPVNFSLTSTDENGSCNGTVTADVSSGQSPFSYNWQPGGQTTQTATGLCSGTYTVTVYSSNGCSKTDSVVVNLGTEISENNNLSFHFYPNPASEKISINFNSNTLIINSNTLIIGNIMVYNSLGEIVLTKEINCKTCDLDISSLNNGVYFISSSTLLSKMEKLIKITP